MSRRKGQNAKVRVKKRVNGEKVYFFQHWLDVPAVDERSGLRREYHHRSKPQRGVQERFRLRDGASRGCRRQERNEVSKAVPRERYGL